MNNKTGSFFVKKTPVRDDFEAAKFANCFANLRRDF